MTRSLRQIHEAAAKQGAAAPMPTIGDTVRDRASILKSLCSDKGKPQRSPDAEHARVLWRRAEVPQRHAARTELQGQRWLEVLQGLADRLGSGFLVVLGGPRRRGKTQMATELIRRATGRGLTARYIKTFELLAGLRSTHNEDPDRLSAKMGRLLSDRLLVVDQFEMKSMTQFEYEILNWFLDKRYDLVHDTLLCTNHVKSAFIDAVDESIVWRVKETGAFIECDWEAYTGVSG